MGETVDLKDLLLLELECPVCTSSMIGGRLPQVKLISRRIPGLVYHCQVCMNGHACCSYCCPRLPFCPTCRDPSGWARYGKGLFTVYTCVNPHLKMPSLGAPRHCLASARPGSSFKRFSDLILALLISSFSEFHPAQSNTLKKILTARLLRALLHHRRLRTQVTTCRQGHLLGRCYSLNPSKSLYQELKI